VELHDYLQREELYFTNLAVPVVYREFWRFCALPQAISGAVVENIQPAIWRMARWVFPAYLVAAGLFVIPISLAAADDPGAAVSGGLLRDQHSAVEGRPLLRCWLSRRRLPRWRPQWLSYGGNCTDTMVLQRCCALPLVARQQKKTGLTDL